MYCKTKYNNASICFWVKISITHLYTPLRIAQNVSISTTWNELISWNLRDREILEIRNVTCQEMWSVGECHVPDIFIAACQDKSWSRYVRVVYQGKPGLWYLTARAGFVFKRPNYYMELISLYAETQNVQVNNARRSILNLHHFVNAIECILFKILHWGT